MIAPREFAERYIVLRDYWNMVGMPLQEYIDAIHEVEKQFENEDVEDIKEWFEEELQDLPDDEWYGDECHNLYRELPIKRKDKKKYRVTMRSVVYYGITVEAEDEEEACEIAAETDMADFEEEDGDDSEWIYSSVKEI